LKYPNKWDIIEVMPENFIKVRGARVHPEGKPSASYGASNLKIWLRM